MKRLAPFHVLTVLFLAGLILLTLFFREQLLLWRSLLLRYLLWIGLVFVIKLSCQRPEAGRIRGFIHDFSPLLFIVLIYESLGDLIQYLHPDIDPSLIRIDFFIFGVHPTLWMERWIVPWFTDLMSFAYVSYYFIPAALVVTLYFNNQKGLHESIFVLTLGYYLSFIGYILFPAVGPRYAMTHLYSVTLEGSILTDLVRDVLNAIEHNKRDCMPSGHTQMVLIVLYLSYRHERLLFYLFFPLICGLILSTVYLRYHYVVDLFAGAFLALVCVVIGPRLYKLWNVDQRGAS
jgi:membrane-associated phospholipid phosphatase